MVAFSFFRTSSGCYIGLTSRYRAVVARDSSGGRVRVRITDRTCSPTNRGLVFADSAVSIQSGKRKANDWISAAMERTTAAVGV